MKVMLTDKEYNTLVTRMCKYSTPIIQTNYYFDNEDLSMNKKGVTCRIRFKDGIYTATLKYHDVVNHEHSKEHDLYESKMFDPDVFYALGLYCHGVLVTERLILHKSPHIEIVLDRNICFGKIDYELEIEYADEYREKAIEYLSNIADLLVKSRLIDNKDELIYRTQKSKSKSKRFFDIYLKK